MSVPITGIVLIPLGLLLAIMPWRYCIAGLMVFAMMSPAAVLNAGSNGLQPGYYLALLLIGRVGIQIMTEGFVLNRFVISRMVPLFWFMALSFLVLFIALCFFETGVDTAPGNASLMVRPFRLGRENFTQTFYLIENIFLLYAIAHGSARQRDMEQAWDRAMECGLLFAVLICAWQFLSLYGAVPFPSDFFYSNAGYTRADSQSMAGLFRINGPFEEPSTLGYTFTGFLLYSWGRHCQRPLGITVTMMTACIFCMLVSTSTTAFLGLAIFLCIATFDVATGRARLFPRNDEITTGYAISVAMITVSVFIFLVALAANWAAVDIILHKTLFDKSGTNSFYYRTLADLLAVKIFVQTYGIGVGLGSHKANSLVLTLLSNTGAAGLVFFATFSWSLLRGSASITLAKGNTSPPPSRRRFQLGLAGLLAIHVFSNPLMSVLTLWLFMGGLLALQAHDLVGQNRQLTARRPQGSASPLLQERRRLPA